MNKMKKVLSIAVTLTMLLLATSGFVLQRQSSVAYAQSNEYYNEYTLEDVRLMVEAQSISYESEYGYTYYESYAERVTVQQNGRPFGHLRTLNNITRTTIIPNNRANRIVIVLFACGFTAGTGAGQIGQGSNPAQNSFLWHARGAINTMLNTHPFNLFRDYFAVYADHTASRQQGVSVRFVQ